MKQLFVELTCHPGMRVELDAKTAHHLFDVTRTSPAEPIRVVAANGVFIAHVENKPFLCVDEKTEEKNRNAAPVILCAAMIKADRFEWMIQKAVELGAEAIVPLDTERTIVHLDGPRAEKKRQRWQSIADQAARQCNRDGLARIEPITRLEEIDRWKSERNICAYEKEAISHHLCSALDHYEGSLTYVIGPEGGLSGREADLLQEKGFELCSLGENILRAETAACYLLSCTEFARAQTLLAQQENEYEDI